ncbi:hypothetical protein B0H16DRAFT_1712926 [Mycena metata]|uniref:Uncharacterized protein n=1 Tax=Mycena metata TaxID=1033252 RepID=A0AAD7NU78_9AGAR|nr:hypothetical protein B0H16DRAFT_1712926 [Mycena metata]
MAEHDTSQRKTHGSLLLSLNGSFGASRWSSLLSLTFDTRRAPGAGPFLAALAFNSLPPPFEMHSGGEMAAKRAAAIHPGATLPRREPDETPHNGCHDLGQTRAADALHWERTADAPNVAMYKIASVPDRGEELSHTGFVSFILPSPLWSFSPLFFPHANAPSQMARVDYRRPCSSSLRRQPACVYPSADFPRDAPPPPMHLGILSCLQAWRGHLDIQRHRLRQCGRTMHHISVPSPQPAHSSLRVTQDTPPRPAVLVPNPRSDFITSTPPTTHLSRLLHGRSP